MGEKKRLVITGFDVDLESRLIDIADRYGYETLSGFVKKILLDFAERYEKNVDKKCTIFYKDE